MSRGTAAALAVLLAALPAAAAKPVPLEGTYEDTCAPWDGAALAINVEPLGLHMRVYGESIAAFEAGKKVSAAKDASGSANTAEVWGKSGRVPYVRVAAEARMDPKTGRGSVTIDGVERAVRFKKAGHGPQFCG